MARAAIYDAILANADLIAIGFDSSSVLVNYDGDQRPNDKFFMVLGWGADDVALRGDDIFERDFKNLTIWVHMYRELSTDFTHIDGILDIIDGILTSMIHVAGTDGHTVSMVEKAGRSKDMRDDAYQTLCRSASYRVLSRETATV